MDTHEEFSFEHLNQEEYSTITGWLFVVTRLRRDQDQANKENSVQIIRIWTITNYS